MDLTALADRAGRLHREGMACSDNGRPAAAVRKLREGLRLLDDRPDGAAALAEVRGRLLLSLAWAESERGRVEVGFRVLDEAEPVVPDNQRGVLLAQRALLLNRVGRNDEALRQFDRAVSLLRTHSSPLDLVKAYNNRSLVHLDEGHVGRARADLRRCGQIAARHGLALHAVLSRVNLGCLDVLAGDLPSALSVFAAARGDYASLAPGRLPALAVERARALVAAGLFTEADRELAYAIEEARQNRLSHTFADALQVRAEAALLAGHPHAAARWARQARARFLGRANTRRAALATLLELRADQAAAELPAEAITGRSRRLANRLERLGLAEDASVAGLVATRALIAAGSSRRAASMMERYGQPRRADRLDTRLLRRLARAELAEATGQPAETSRHLRVGMATLHRHRTQFGCLDLQTGAAVHGRDLARAGLATALASGSPAAVYRWSERARAQALLLPPVRPPDDPHAAAALEELRQVQHALREAEVTGRPSGGLRSRIETLQRVVREHAWSTPGNRETAGPAVVPLSTVHDELAGAALVTYVRHDAALHALVVVDGSASLVAIGRYAAAHEAVLRLRADLDAQAGRALPPRLAAAVANAARHDAQALAAIVLDPIADLVGDRDLVVIPTGTLLTVPWSVLPACAGRPVTVAPSAAAWQWARRRLATHRRAGAHGPTLLVAGPGNARGDAEIRAIAACHPGATILTGAAATPAATLDSLGRVDLAHIAAHGQHRAENALFSSLELAGGALLGYDLQQVHRVPPAVVLSSCDLGLADIRPGDEIFGMASALLAARCATVIASVVRVADESAMTVMVNYHKAIAAGQSPAAALAGAGQPLAATGFVCFGAG